MLAVTWMVGKSICGSEATGKKGKAAMPTKATAAISKDVATGRRMNGSETFISYHRSTTTARSSPTPVDAPETDFRPFSGRLQHF
jgi:hypothetical protein